MLGIPRGIHHFPHEMAVFFLGRVFNIFRPSKSTNGSSLVSEIPSTHQPSAMCPHLFLMITLWWTNIAIEHGHRNSGFIFPLKMVIFHCYVSSPEGKSWSSLLFAIRKEASSSMSGIVPGCQKTSRRCLFFIGIRHSISDLPRTWAPIGQKSSISPRKTLPPRLETMA